MTTATDRLGEQALEVKSDLQEMGQTVRAAAQEQFERVEEKAGELYEQGRDNVHGVACACEQYVRQQPLRAVLIAAGVGWLLGMFWKRR